MGQTSLPSINRAGYFSYWESSWDNKFKYQFFFIKFLFLERFFPLFFLSKFFCTKNLIYKNNAGLKKKIFFFKNFLYDEEDEDDIEVIDEDTDLIETSSKKFYKFCLSKIWFLKYKNYIIINMYLLSPNTSFKKKIFFYKNTEFLNDLDNTFFKKFSLKKFFFKFNYFFFKTLLIQKNEPFIFDKFISFRIKNFFFKNKIINNASNKAIFIKLKDSLKKRNLHNSRSDHFLKKMYNSF